MNVTTFNDPFERPLVADMGQAEFNKLAVAPLFDYEVRLDELDEHLARGREAFSDEHGSFEYPFKRLRLEAGATGELQHQLVFVDRKNSAAFVRYQAMVMNDGTVYFRIVNLPRAVITIERTVFRLQFDVGREADGSLFVNNRFDAPFSLDWFKGDRWQPVDIQQPGMLRHLANTISVVLLAFGYDAMLPTNHRAEVVPATEGKSVEWRRQRTHYTLITHGHPANRAEVGSGARVASDRAGELTRMAHNRRAHYRTLKSARFRYARGKRIFVRAAWVGPKEWRDAGGKQIYRILEPVES